MVAVAIENFLSHYVKECFYLSEQDVVVRELFSQALDRFGRRRLATICGVSERSVYFYASGSRTPSLSAVMKVAREIGAPNFLAGLYRGPVRIATWGRAATTLPTTYSEELAYLCGVIAGDGHLSRQETTQVDNQSRMYLESTVSNLVIQVFSLTPQVYPGESCSRLIIHSRPAFLFLNEIVGLPKGKKKGILRVPEFVFEHRDFKRLFVRGLFETDGGFTNSPKGVSILISSATEEFLLEVQELLHDLGVEIGGPYRSGGRRGYELRSWSRETCATFKRRIGFVHPVKVRTSPL